MRAGTFPVWRSAPANAGFGRRLRRRLLLGATLPLAATLLACGNAPPRPDVSATITILHPADERALGPCHDLAGRLLFSSPLVGVNDRGEIEPRVATRWEHGEDGTWTVHLRSDVRWHDGARFTARDVKFTWDLLLHPDFGWLPPDLVRMEVVNDTTFRARYGGGAGSPLDDWRVYHPEHLLKDLPPADLCGWEFWTEQVGNGPFRFVRKVPKTMVELEANPDYFGGKPRVGRVILKFGDNGITELLAGNVDVARIDAADVLKLQEDPRFRVYHGVQAVSGEAIYWNQEAFPALADARVRRALTLAIDRRQLHRFLDYPENLPLYDGASNRWLVERRALPPPLPHDHAAAARLLSEAGWVDGDGDGVRERDGRPLRFELLAGSDRTAVFIQDQLRRVGAGVEVVVQGELLAERIRRGEFDAAIGGFWNMLYGGQAELEILGEGNRIGYHSSAALAVLDSMANTSEPEESDRLALRLHEITARDLPLTVLHPHVFAYAAHRRVKGLGQPLRANPMTFVEELWIEEEP